MKKVYGVGIYDLKNESRSKAYNVWNSMLKRCYDTKFQEQHRQSYKGCCVDNDWLVFSKFKSFYDNYYVNDFVLDKDILNYENKCYSQYSCRFVPVEINQIFVVPLNGSNMLGTNKLSNGKYESTITICGEKFKEIFETELEAHQWWQRIKSEHIKCIAEGFKDKIFPDVYHSMINRADKILEDLENGNRTVRI